MTARTSFLAPRAAALTAGCAGRRTSRPRGGGRRAAATTRPATTSDGERREEDRQAGGAERGALRVERQRARRPRRRAGARTRREQDARGQEAERRAGDAAISPATSRARGRRASPRAQQRAEHEASAAQRRARAGRSRAVRGAAAARAVDDRDERRARRAGTASVSRKEKSVPSKSRPRSAAASAPASSAGRNGRMPTAAASPRLGRISRKRSMRVRVPRRMTIDETPGARAPAANPAHGPSRSTARDIERYAGLFAERTQVMKSSAMRDLMAITERAEVISLAGGLPDTIDLPARDVRRADGAGGRATPAPRALQYGPTEGLAERQGCIVEVMAAEGMHGDPDDILVTTGGQQVIDLVCKTLIDPGDVIIAEGRPTRARSDLLRLPGRCRADRDGRRRHADRRAGGDARAARRRGPHAEVHLHGADLPEPRRRDDVARAPPRLVRDRRTSASCSCSRTTRMACCATRAIRCRRCYALDGGEYVIYLGTFSKILSPGIRLGWAAAPRAGAREDEHRQAGRRPLLLAAHPVLRHRLLRRRPTGATT